MATIKANKAGMRRAWWRHAAAALEQPQTSAEHVRIFAELQAAKVAYAPAVEVEAFMTWAASVQGWEAADPPPTGILWAVPGNSADKGRSFDDVLAAVTQAGSVQAGAEKLGVSKQSLYKRRDWPAIYARLPEAMRDRKRAA
jgi:hypothetical protein